MQKMKKNTKIKDNEQKIGKKCIFQRKLDLESIMSSLRMDFEKGGISIRID